MTTKGCKGINIRAALSPKMEHSGLEISKNMTSFVGHEEETCFSSVNSESSEETSLAARA